MSALYTVTIERKRREDWIDRVTMGNYYWAVGVQPDSTSTEKNWELRGSGNAKSIESAKKKALKHILAVDHDILEGMKFGMVFETVGTAQEIKKSFEQTHYETE
jgi:hypothetical protein